MKKVTTYQLIQGLKRNIIIVLTPAFLAFAFVFGFLFLNTKGYYEAKAVLMATSQDDEISYNKLILNEKLGIIHGEILKSPDIYKKTSAALKKGGSDIGYKEIMKNTHYEVNPQAGMIAFSYRDKNKDRAGNSLKSICENFRLLVKENLSQTNLSYLHEVSVDEANKLKPIIFSMIAMFLGAMIGVMIVIFKVLLTDNIGDNREISEAGYNILASSNEKFYLEKIKSKLSCKNHKIFGILNIAKKNSDEFIRQFLDIFSRNNRVLLIKNKKIEGDFSKKYLLETTDPIDILYISTEDSARVIESSDFENYFSQIKEEYDYIFIYESRQVDTYILSKYEDFKIILVDSNRSKKDLDMYIKDFKDIGILDIGLVYYE